MSIPVNFYNFQLFKPMPDIVDVVRIGLSEKKYISGILVASTAFIVLPVAILKGDSLSWENLLWVCGIILAMESLVYLFLKSWFRHVANRNYIEISHNGFAYRGGLIAWNELESFCIKITSYEDGGDKELLHLNTFDRRLSKIIDFGDLNTDAGHLRSCIIHLNTNTNLIDNGVHHVTI